MPIYGKTKDCLLDIAAFYLDEDSKKDNEIELMREKVKESYISPLLLYSSSIETFEEKLSPNTKKLLHVCGITAQEYKKTWDIQNDFFVDKTFEKKDFILNEKEIIILQNMITDKKLCLNISEFKNIFAKCQVFIMLTFGLIDHFFSPLLKNNKYPYQTLGGIIKQHQIYLQYYFEKSDVLQEEISSLYKKCQDFHDLEIDIVQYMCSLPLSCLLKLGWWF